MQLWLYCCVAWPIPRDAPDLDPGELDVVLAALFAGLALNEQVTARLHAAGFDDVRFSHGFVFQHLVPGPLPVGELARRMEVSQQAASKAAAELERLGYLERTPDPADARVRRLGLSARGRAAVAAGAGGAGGGRRAGASGGWAGGRSRRSRRRRAGACVRGGCRGAVRLRAALGDARARAGSDRRCARCPMTCHVRIRRPRTRPSMRLTFAGPPLARRGDREPTSLACWL